MMERIVNRIHRNATEVRQGNWANPSAGGFSDALFYSNGRHVVVTQSDGTLITVLKDATGNKHFNNANVIFKK
jgi:hypothetical protein